MGYTRSPCDCIRHQRLERRGPTPDLALSLDLPHAQPDVQILLTNQKAQSFISEWCPVNVLSQTLISFHRGRRSNPMLRVIVGWFSGGSRADSPPDELPNLAAVPGNGDSSSPSRNPSAYETYLPGYPPDRGRPLDEDMNLTWIPKEVVESGAHLPPGSARRIQGQTNLEKGKVAPVVAIGDHMTQGNISGLSRQRRRQSYQESVV
ncbi:hypothetical protein EV426DRAFT_645700 [Tirmania nivea]|nr:hypothetical protein EV426DRAFT_645700 [Tirmania nivea]